MSEKDRFDKLIEGTGSKPIGTPPKTTSELVGWLQSSVPYIAALGAVYVALIRAGLMDITPD